MTEGSRESWKQCCRATAKRLPVLTWLPKYSLQWLQLDSMAGLTVGMTVVPQALAYAVVAGLPVEYGLYSSFMGCFIYCLLGTSKDVTLGPTAIMSLLVSSYAFHEPALAVLLAFLSGCIQLAMGFLHLGFILDFISYPVIKGFTSAAAVIIGFNQVKTLLGLQNIPKQFILQVYYTFCRITETRSEDAILGVFCVMVLLVLQQMKKGIPRSHSLEPLPVRISRYIIWTTATARNALVVLFAGLVAYSFQVTGSQPFSLTGTIPQGLPRFQSPPFSIITSNQTIGFKEMVQAIGPGLAVVPLMGLLETMAIAKAFASQNKYQIDPNQELLAMGFTNLLGSFVSSYPVTGSFGRTAVNARTGVCTPAGGLITGALVLLSLAYLTSLFYYIPKAALAAVIICAVAPVFDARIFRTLWQVKRLDLVPLCVTFLVCFWEVQYGIIAGVIVSGILLLYPLARPRMEVVKDNAIIIKPENGLQFPAIDFLRDIVHKQALSGREQHTLPFAILFYYFSGNAPNSDDDRSGPHGEDYPEPQQRKVILDCSYISRIDYTVVLGLSELLQEFQHRELHLIFIGLQAHVLEVLLAADLNGFRNFSTLKDAKRSLGDLHVAIEDMMDDIQTPAGMIQ